MIETRPSRIMEDFDMFGSSDRSVRNVAKSLSGGQSQFLGCDTRLLWSARETARKLSISAKTLWTYSAPRGPIIPVRIGARVLYDPRSLEQFIADRAQQPEGGAA